MRPYVPALALIVLSCTGGGKAPVAPAAAAICADALADVLATVNGEAITLEAFNAEGAGRLVEARKALYDARSETLESMIIDRMIAKELETRGMTEAELISTEVDGKLQPPSEEEVAAFYAANLGQMRGAPLEEMAGPIANHLQQQQAGELTRQFIASLEAKYAVVRNLEPLRIDVDPGDSPRIGPADAPITIVEFSDFQCPYCVGAADTVKEVRAKYGDKVSVVYRHFPLPMHPQAPLASEAAECANEQEQFWGYHDALFADQKAWTTEDLQGYARTLSLDAEAFDSCLASRRHAPTVAQDLEEGRAAGMSGTPGFYVNGMVVSGAQPASVFIALIDRELRRLGK
jgi:protein-disulfide isomerase